MRRTAGTIRALATLAVFVACGEGTPTGPVVSAVEVAPVIDTLRTLGRTVQLSAVVRLSDGTTDGAAAVAWSSSAPSVVSVDGTGLATALRGGEADIRATWRGVTGSVRVVVRQTVVALELGTVDTLVSLDETARVTVTATDSSGAAVADPDLAWQSLDPTVATVSDGEVTATGNGSTVVSASTDGIEATVDVVVEQRVDPAASTVTLSRAQLLPADTIRVTVEARDALGSVVPGGGAVVALATAGGSSEGSFGAVSDDGGGTYEADFVGTLVGEPTEVRATLDGEEVGGVATLRVVGFTDIAAAGFAWQNSSGTTTGGFTCGTLTTGEMYCWGDARQGVLGNGTKSNEPSLVPTLVSGGHSWTDVETGGYHVCGLTTSGEIYCWGDGDVGQIGIGQSGKPADVTEPRRTLTDSIFVSVDIGSGWGACAMTVGGSPMCWGQGSFGRLGNDTDTLSSVPTPVHGDLTVEALSTNAFSTCAIDTGGVAYCWGSRWTLGTTPSDMCGGTECQKTPVAVDGGHTFRPILSVGSNVVCAVTDAGTTYCWGSGYLGDGMDTRFSVSPVAVSGGLDFTALDGGVLYHCAIASGGSAYCWGRNDHGRLGIGTEDDVLEPTAVVGGIDFATITTSDVHACGVTADGQAYCWGGNDSGELGDGTQTSSTSPVRVRLFR